LIWGVPCRHFFGFWLLKELGWFAALGQGWGVYESLSLVAYLNQHNTSFGGCLESANHFCYPLRHAPLPGRSFAEISIVFILSYAQKGIFHATLANGIVLIVSGCQLGRLLQPHSLSQLAAL
jgi:hypothetical protein